MYPFLLDNEYINRASPGGSDVQDLHAMQEMQVRSLGQEDLLEVGNGNRLQYSRLENSMDRGAWWATVHGVVKSQI